MFGGKGRMTEILNSFDRVLIVLSGRLVNTILLMSVWPGVLFFIVFNV